VRLASRYPEPITRNAAACEADGCDTWTLEPEQHGFIEIVWGDERMVYCSVDCLLKDVASRSKPIEVIQWEAPGGQGT
jgi:hypothetical protein